MIRGALTVAIGWAALAIQPETSEALKVAGVAVVAAWLLPGALATLLRQPALAFAAGCVLLSSWFALEPAVWVGSAARTQGALVALALIVLAGASIRLNVDERRSIRRAVAVLGGLVAAYVLVQCAGLDPLVWQGAVLGRPSATLSNATTLAGWLLLLMPATAAAALDAARQRWVWIVLALVQFAALLASGTRSAMAALALAAIGGWILSQPRWRRWGLVLLVVALVGVAVLAAWRPASLQDRTHLWRAGLAALVATEPLVDHHGERDTHDALRPWLGYGLDLQQPALAQAAATTPGARADAAGWVADRAHQGIVDRALEMGLAGLIAGLMLTVAVARGLWSGWHSGDPQRQREALVLGVSLAAWLLHLQASFALTGDRTLAWVWIGMALAPGGQQGVATDSARQSQWLASISESGSWLLRGLALGASAATMYAALAASGHLSSAATARLAPALQAERDYRAGQSAYARASVETGRAATLGMLEAAVAFERALQRRPYDPDAALAAASARVEAAAYGASVDELARARTWASAARRLAPADPRLPALDQRIAAVAARLNQAE